MRDQNAQQLTERVVTVADDDPVDEPLSRLKRARGAVKNGRR